MDKEEMKRRTKEFSLRVIRLVNSLPNGKVANTISGQLLRSGTSVGANYRAACRGRSKRDFANKLSIVLEEADESLFWMELLVEANIIEKHRLEALMQEADEIIAILVKSIKTARGIPDKESDEPDNKNTA